jgi:hypothetical protein
MKLKSLATRFQGKSIVMVGEPKTPGRPKGAKPLLYTANSVNSKSAKDFIKKKIVSEEISDMEVINGKGSKRYLISRDLNRFRVLTIQRLEQQKHLEFLVNKMNGLLDSGSKEKPEKVASRIKKVIDTIDASSWMSVTVVDKKLHLKINKSKLKGLLYLNGCHVIETSLPEDDIIPKRLMELFKEHKNMKSAFHNKSLSVPNKAIMTEQANQIIRGHGVILMLAYTIHRHLKKAWQSLNISPEDAINQLSTICALKSEDHHFIPTLNPSTQKLFEALKIKPPKKLP